MANSPNDGPLTEAEIAPRGVLMSRGLRVPRDPSVLRAARRTALREGTYEGREADAILRVVQPGDRVLDLGAGIGYMGALMAVKRQVARVVSYEANPSLIPYARRLHAANDVSVVELRNRLLTPTASDPQPFYVRRNFLASSLDRDTNPEGIVQTVHLPCDPLPELLAQEPFDVLVCDIEGAEATLLPAGDWSTLRAAVIELHPQWIGAPGVRAVFEAMQRGGLTYFPKASQGKVVCFRRDW